ncbi:drug resistance transporter, EmrB/QacA subfamily [Thermanaeromonas toyohensis ToBE]|uniref:Drug resistance transporter, EmrB/QacA subfamily n=1 Tax=Thermanaeromonas toyohensis ToBE TaxID=698762 RepID=A0A1W1W0F6_9FIRM|nr:MFS transporter [Thermanaeromonas toyohensis]SMB99085.1 drug resistance transporter, EmrB/QacA subfamily [Thermanaeromonas toyohensis ToBE]
MSTLSQDVVQPRFALIAATLASFLTPFTSSSLNLAIPSIGAEFKADAMSLNWVVSAFLLTSAAFLLPFGRLADLYGRKKIFLAGISGYTLFSLLSALAPNLLLLITFRALQGISSAMIFGTAVAILTSVFPPQERGRVLGINAAAVYTGLTLGPFLGGLLTHQFGWRSIFLATFLVGAITLTLAGTKLKSEWVGNREEKFDITGSFLSVFSLGALIYGSSTLSSGVAHVVLLFIGIAGISIFVWYERTTPYPLLNLRLFTSNRPFAFSNLAALINYSATFGSGFLLSLYLQLVKGLDPQVAGSVLLIQSLIQVILSPIAGYLSDKMEPRLVASTGMALTSLGLFILAFLGPYSSLIAIITNLILLGTGFGLFSSPNTNAVMSSVPKAYYGIASSTLGTMRLVGQAFSMAVVALIFSFYFKGIPITPETSSLLLTSNHISFLAFAVLSAAGILPSLARGEIHGN